ncbi:MAG: xylulose kinase, partial [Deltaproteobacteria bacterium]|nr:xylulose kinase [Deltaproteobacteria bacterium]
MENKKKYILAVDLGTSGPKTALISVYGDVVDSEFQDTPIILLPGGGAEQDPEGWWNAIMSTSQKVLKKGLVPPEDIVAVSVTTQWSGTVALDQNGRHLMNAVIWMDSRGSESIKEILEGPVKIEGYPVQKLITWMKLTGGAPSHSGKDSICHIL